MPDDFPYMRLWVADALADLAEHGWTDEEFGAYMRLLLVAWKKGSIPADLAGRARLVSANPRRLAALWPAFEHKWTDNGNGGLVNPRQERERQEALGKSKKAKEAADKRWGNR